MAIIHGGLHQQAAAGAGSEVKSPSSRSACLRERGNTLYREATAQTTLPAIRSCRLDDAIRLYSQALSLSQTPSDKAMCCKNLGQAFWARAKLNLALAEQQSPKNVTDPGQAFDSISLELLSSVSHFLDALNFSRPASQSKEWVQGIHWTLVDIAWTVDDIRESSPIGGRIKGRFLGELCAMFQQKLPGKNIKLQASAIVHKACAQNGLRSAMGLDARFAQQAVLQDCLHQLSVAQAHTDPSAAGFLEEIFRLREEILRRIEVGDRLQRQKSRSFSYASENRGTSEEFQQARLRRNQSFSESAASRRTGGGGGICGGGGGGGGGSQPSDVERMFNSMSPLEFLRGLYLKYPPPGKSNSCEMIRDIGDLKSAYKRAISHYHPDHHRSKQSQLSDEITKYLIFNLNCLKAE